jgi:hypothetical protein
MSRKSLAPNFCPPARSACPGRGRFNTRGFSGGASGFSDAITSDQFAQSLFSIIRATGEPSVRPCLTPLKMSARSRSIFIRPPRP